jgi:hypothetical protein
MNEDKCPEKGYIAIVKHNGKEVWRSDQLPYYDSANYAASRYILNHQNQSVMWATRYGGWLVEVEERPVKFVGGHPLRWILSWNKPTTLFLGAESSEALALARELPEVHALVEALHDALKVAREALTWCSERDKYHIYKAKLDEDASALAPFEEKRS